MGKPSAVGQLTRPIQPFLLGVDKWVVSCNQITAIAKQWWRRLMNAYEVKAGMVCLQGNSCVIRTWALQMRASHNGTLYKSIFFLSRGILCFGHRSAAYVLCAVLMRVKPCVHYILSWLQTFDQDRIVNEHKNAGLGVNAQTPSSGFV